MGQMKKAWIEMLKKNNGVAPKTTELINWAAGNYNADDEAVLNNVMFLFDKMMAALFSHSYGKKTKWYKPPYQCTTASSKKPLFTASNRALCVLMIENCRTKWHAIYELRKDDDKVPIPPKPHKDDKDHEDWKYHKARWSNPDGGKTKFTSWDEEGLRKMAKWTAKIDKFMTENKETMMKNEDKLLEYWQREEPKVEVGATEPGKKRRRNGKEPTPRKKIDLGCGGEKKNFEDFSDDED